MVAPSTKKPRVLLVGAGRFGQHHLRILKNFDTAGVITLKGVVVRTADSVAALKATHDVPVYRNLDTALLESVDAVDIVTPPETHFELVKKCLTYTNVFVEKPLAMNMVDAEQLARYAQEQERILSVGHIFRFHPVVEKLKELLGDRGLPLHIEGAFINPLNTDQGRDISFELLHLFDIVDYVWPSEPEVTAVKRAGRVAIVEVQYGETCTAQFTLGWMGKERQRKLVFEYPDMNIEGDIVRSCTRVRRGATVQTDDNLPSAEPLEKELRAFITTLHTGKNELDARMASRIITIAEQSEKR